MKDIDKLLKWILRQQLEVSISINPTTEKKLIDNEIELIIVGPEKPLVDGIVDFFESKNIKIFGPNKIASQLEGSKIFTKELCKKYNIPTADFGIFDFLKPEISLVRIYSAPE